MSKLLFRIYRIDNEHPDFRDLGIDAMPQKIVDKYNEFKQAIVFEPVHATNFRANIGNNKEIFFYKKASARALPHLWRAFFQDAGINFGAINTELHHMVGFIVDRKNTQLFAVTTGQAYVTFEKYVDYDFPLVIARKITHPEIKSGEVKGLTGYLQASSLHFRRPRRISSTESIGSIWTQFSGKLRGDVFSDADFVNIFGQKNKVSIEIKGSVGVKQKLESYTDLANYIDWLWRVHELDATPTDAQNDFAFLDAVRKISTRRFPDKVQALWTKLQNDIANNTNENIALCHREYAQYLNADNYLVKYDGQTLTPFQTPPELSEILSGLTYSPTDLAQVLEKTDVEAIYDTEVYLNIDGPLKDLVCSEVVDGGKTFFLLNNEWFELKEDFIRMVSADFSSFVSDVQYDAGLTLPPWTQATEGAYNATAGAGANFILGDKKLTENTELFDLLHWDNEKVYILHVKAGFGVKVRDVASQVFNAAQIIENDVITSGKSLLSQHYDKLDTPSLSKAEFLSLFDKKRTYVLGYGRPNSLATDNASVRSNIAKLELVQLRNDMRRFEGKSDFRLQWIQKS